MSPPGSSSLTPAADTQRKRPRRDVAKRKAVGIAVQDAESGGFSLLVRAAQRNKFLPLGLSEPGQGEECSITLEPIQEYTLPFLPDSVPPAVMPSQPNLTKASLPCGHGFSALALLYHFAKNSMTCPICRAGHAKALMTEQSVPVHLRRHFSKHLANLRREESREQVAADALAAAHVLQQEEVSHRPSLNHHAGFMPVTRIVLILYVYDTMGGESNNSNVAPGSSSSGREPMLELELPLTSSLNLGTLAFESSGYSLAQLNLNLLRLPTRARAFEIGVGIQSLFHGNLLLFRTVRFPATGALHRVVFARETPYITEPTAVEVLTMAGVDDLNVFYCLRWMVSMGGFSNMVLRAASQSADEGSMVAV